MGLSRERVVTELKKLADARDVHKTTGLVLAAVYDGMAARILSGEFDEPDYCPFDCDNCHHHEGEENDEPELPEATEVHGDEDL